MAGRFIRGIGLGADAARYRRRADALPIARGSLREPALDRERTKRIDLPLVKLMATYNQEIKRAGSLPTSWSTDALEILLTEFNRASLRDRSLFRFPSFTYLYSSVLPSRPPLFHALTDHFCAEQLRAEGKEEVHARVSMSRYAA